LSIAQIFSGADEFFFFFNFVKFTATKKVRQLFFPVFLFLMDPEWKKIRIWENIPDPQKYNFLSPQTSGSAISGCHASGLPTFAHLLKLNSKNDGKGPFVDQRGDY
jgi:hypothetical protein